MKKGIIATPSNSGWKGGPYDHMQREWSGQKDGSYVPDPDEELLLGTLPGAVHLQNPPISTKLPAEKEQP